MTFLGVKNRAVSTLAAGIDDDDLSLSVAAGEGVKYPAANFHITIDDEIILCSSRSTDTLTIERGAEGTTPAAHLEDAVIKLRITAEIIEELQNAIPVDVQKLTSSGDWTKPASGSRVLVQIWAGGGSGGKATTGDGGGGGGGGACIEAWFDIDDLGATEAVTLGDGGAGQTTPSDPGNVGGNSTFGSLLTVYGGGGGGGNAGRLGGGGGGGLNSVGAKDAASNAGAQGGSPSSEYVGAGGPTNVKGMDNYSGGGGGGGAGNAPKAGGFAKDGGGAGGGGTTGGLQNTTGIGGNSLRAGAGGGGGGASVGGADGGVSSMGGDGGDGGYDGNAGGVGTQPGGGGGGSETGTSGAGGKGQAIISTF